MSEFKRPDGFIKTFVNKTDSDLICYEYSNGRTFSNRYGYFQMVDTCWVEILPEVDNGQVTSDGGSSSYYELEVAGHKIETHNVITDVFGNDFDFGNMFKAQVRIWAQLQGGGKAGTSIEYDLNKIIYTCEKLKAKYNDKS